MNWKIFVASAGAGIFLGVGVHLMLEGRVEVGALIILAWLINIWLLFKIVKEQYPI